MKRSRAACTIAERFCSACTCRRDESYERRLTDPDIWMHPSCIRSISTVAIKEDGMTDIEIASDWDAVADAWDTQVDAAERPTEAPTTALLAAAAVEPGDRVLELAAGP